MPSNQKSNRTLNLGIAVGFILILWLPTLDSLFSWNNSAKLKENRRLKPFPSLAASDGLKTFTSDLNNYCNDHFGLRQQLIVWGEKIKLDWFKESSLSGAALGKEGWLFKANEAIVGDHLESRFFETERLAAWKQLLEIRRDWLASRGIDYVFMIAPNKDTIYPEFLPTWMPQRHPPTRLDQFVDYMKTNSKVDVLDLRPAMLAGKRSAQIYAKTDTHWNSLGSLLAAQALVERLARRHPDLRPLQLDEFEVHNQPDIGGDLARLLIAEETLRETNNPVLKPKSSREPETKLVFHLKGEIVATQGIAPDGKIMGFGDSFGKRFFAYLGYRFKQADFFYEVYDERKLGSIGQTDDHVGLRWEKEYIEKMKPQILVDETVEEYLWNHDPTILLELDGLKQSSKD